MKVLVCDVNLFSMGQYVQVIDTDTNETGEIGCFTIDELGEEMTKYCQANNVNKIKLFGNRDYLNHSVVTNIKKYAFQNYGRCDIDIEVIDK